MELAASEALAQTNDVPPEAARLLRKHASFDLKRIQEIEREVKHDVIAFTTAVSESLAAAGEAGASRWLHYGLTSNDVVDTAQALMVRSASDLILRGITDLAAVLKTRAFEFKDTVQIGRTHGMHAEPITFGLKLALWYDEVQRNLTRFSAAAEGMRVGKISGAVGTFGHIGPQAEERICQRLGLRPAAIASQVISRDRHANYIATLALVAATLEKIALEIRHLQRTEVREVEEPFAQGQKGSSAMPHKRNPVTCEQICGLARVVRGNVQPAFENIALWHERDISHSSVERIILPDTTTAVDYMLARTIWLISGLAGLAGQNEAQSGSDPGPGVLRTAPAGPRRRRGCCVRKLTNWSRDHAMTAPGRRTAISARLIESDPAITKHLSPEAFENTFSVSRQLRNVDQIFQRVFPTLSQSSYPKSVLPFPQGSFNYT